MYSCKCRDNDCGVKEGMHLSVGGEDYIEQGGFNVYCPMCDCKFFYKYYPIHNRT